MEEWNEAKRNFKFYDDSDYETASNSSFITASIIKSEFTEVCQAVYSKVGMSLITLHVCTGGLSYQSML